MRPCRDAAQRRVDLLLDARVDRRRRVVEQQDLRVGEQRARQRDALALTAREREALLADDGVVAVGQPQDELVRFGGARRGLDLGSAVASGRPNAMLARDRVGEEERVLEHDADVCGAATASVHVAHVDAVDRDAPVVHVVEARQQQADRRLARTRAADERDRLARRDREREVAQHRLGRRVAERHVVEPHLAARAPRAATASGASCTSGVESSRS